MSRPTRWSVAVFVFLAPLAGVTYAYPEWLCDAGLDFWEAPALRSEIEREQHRTEKLDGSIQSTLRRIGGKGELAREVIAGRLTLREAAVAFREFNAHNPRFVPLMRIRYESCSEDELHARNVIDTVRGLLDEDPRQDEVMARLTADLDALRQEWSVVRSP